MFAEAEAPAATGGEVWLLALLCEGDLAPPLLGLHEVESLALGCLPPGKNDTHFNPLGAFGKPFDSNPRGRGFESPAVSKHLSFIS